MYHQINKCEVCGSDGLSSVLNLGMHPMCDDLVLIGDSRVCREYPIEIMFCKTCLTAHQHYQVPKRDLFPNAYHYRSRFTADVLNGMEALVDSCEQQFGSLAGKTVLDIGCNDGSLLDFFEKKGAVTIGIEPTGAFEDAKQKGHVVYNDYLSVSAAKKIIAMHGAPDFITFTNVFAHIENLGEVMDSLKVLIEPKTVVVIENHYLGSVLASNQFDTFYHEHPRSYSYTSFTYMVKSLGLELLGVEFPARYGGNIRVFMGDASRDKSVIDSEGLKERESRFFDEFAELVDNIEAWKVSKKAAILELFEKYGKLRAKAFPGRAAILVKILGLDENFISAVYEKPGSLKIGHYLPGTRIPILSDENLMESGDRTLPLLNLAWHIPVEIRHYMSELGYEGDIIDVLSAEDFYSSGRV
ncbi:methyltransferase domain-containing protein [Mariprofundus ferrooxydans]|uniref:class I SAM-dependent methyltransferase n=1 Tax=Mariprofundus ferrooxydans TaxID=314344 RepID=UPI00056CE185